MRHLNCSHPKRKLRPFFLCYDWIARSVFLYKIYSVQYSHFALYGNIFFSLVQTYNCRERIKFNSGQCLESSFEKRISSWTGFVLLSLQMFFFTSLCCIVYLAYHIKLDRYLLQIWSTYNDVGGYAFKLLKQRKRADTIFENLLTEPYYVESSARYKQKSGCILVSSRYRC